MDNLKKIIKDLKIENIHFVDVPSFQFEENKVSQENGEFYVVSSLKLTEKYNFLDFLIENKDKQIIIYYNNGNIVENNRIRIATI